MSDRPAVSAAIHVVAASIDITPGEAVALAGFRGRDQGFTNIHSPLEANAVAFRQGSRCAVVLALDTLFIGPVVHAALVDHFVAHHGQRAADLLVVASHTHFAPSIDETKPMLGTTDPAYSALVIGRCRDLIDRLLTAPCEPARMTYRRGGSRAAINRRRPWPLPYLYDRRIVSPQAAMAPNDAAPFDPTIRAWTFAGESGQPVALIWHYACHPTGFPHPLEVSADFPGVVRAGLRQQLGRDLPVLFLQGFAGDIRPRVPESRPLSRRLPRALMFGPSFDVFSPAGWSKWANALTDDVARTFESAAAEDGPLCTVDSTCRHIRLSDVVAGETPGRMVQFQRLRILPGFDVVAVAAEPLVGLRALLPFPDAVAVGYLGDVFGYWPTDEDQRHGGYEVRHYLRPFGLTGRLRDRLDPVFSAAMQGLADPS